MGTERNNRFMAERMLVNERDSEQRKDIAHRMRNRIVICMYVNVECVYVDQMRMRE